MKKDKIAKAAAEAINGLVSIADLSGQSQQFHELVKTLKNRPVQELVVENPKPQKSLRDLAFEKKDALDTLMSQANDQRERQNDDLKKIKNKNMDSKKDILSKKMVENKKDVTASKKDILKEKFKENKVDTTPSKKDILRDKFKENKPLNPAKNDITEKKKADFQVNKKDILGDKPTDKKPDKVKADNNLDKKKLF